MSEAFSQSSPVYEKKDTINRSTPYPTKTIFKNPKASPSLYSASASISSASLPLSNTSTSTSNKFLSITHSKCHHYKFK